MHVRQSVRKPLAALAAASLLAVPLSACSVGGDDSAPTAVASIPALSGRSTAIKLDKGFVAALTKLKLTPGVVGQIQHDNSGLSLSAGGTTVQLTNFNVDPGVSRVYGTVKVK
jgi:hypothetical protein